ncbi:MAG: hypothetical protein HKN40_10170 [Winogradskyella sp.]|uniref:hypothetical protein n=1 Tax=Winogradskyella sp. TaxID=1883156 RepID=UPI0017D5BCC9|nr:hypothetical protein [Winogradskyella sp.]
MKTKLYFGFIIAIFTLFGVYIDASHTPNQQIVVHFSNVDKSPEETNNAIETISNKLLSIGVTKIQIGQVVDGRVRITYYSTAKLQIVKGLFLANEGFRFAYQSNPNNSGKEPKGQDNSGYELNISEISESNTTNWDFEGTLVIEQTQKSDRLSHPKTKVFAGFTPSKTKNATIQNAISIYGLIHRSIDAYAHKIPEVRAGPATLEIT